MNILIIGSDGFIGRRCVDFFLQKKVNVWSCGLRESNSENYFKIDSLNEDFDKVFQNSPFDVCINASGSANVNFSFEYPEIDFRLNVINVNKILLAIRKYNPTCKLINFSSAAVYGNPSKLPISEDFPAKPMSPYGFHKLQSEYLLTEYHKFFGLHTISLRVFSAYGPGLSKQLFWDLYQKSLTSQNVELFGSGEESRDFIYIDDLIQIVDLVIEKASFDGSVFNVASGHETKIKEAVALFCKLFCPEKSFNFSGKQKIGDPNNWCADISKVQNLGYIPSVNMETGLKSYIRWLTERE